MYQDPSIGDIKVYYAVTKIIVLESTEEVHISEQYKRTCRDVSDCNFDKRKLITLQ